MQPLHVPEAVLSSRPTIGLAICRPAAEAWSAGRLQAARARPSTTSLRHLLLAPMLPAQQVASCDGKARKLKQMDVAGIVSFSLLGKPHEVCLQSQEATSIG